MGRRLKIRTPEMGDLELYLIYQYGEVWEEEWALLQGQSITNLLTVITQEVMTHALKGWSKPLVTALGIPPEGAIRKLDDPRCYRRELCPFHVKKSCIPKHPKMPLCFEPEGIEDPTARLLGSELIKLWRAGVYILVVTHVLDDPSGSLPL